MVYADVFLGQRGSSQQLTYAVPASIIPYIKEGSLIIVPVRRKKVEAVVVKLHRRVRPELVGKIKEVISIDKKSLGISPSQIKVSKSLAKQYLTNQSDIIFRMLISKRSLADSGTGTGSTSFVQAPWPERVKRYGQIVGEYDESLILFATRAHLQDFLRRSDLKGVIVLDGSAKTRRIISELSAKAVFLGTVGDSFFPLSGKSLIIVDQPEHIGARYSNRPHLKAVDIALERSAYEGCDCCIGQPLLHPSQVSRIKAEKLSLFSVYAQDKNVTVASRVGSRELLLPSALKLLKGNIDQGKKTLIFVASKGWYGAYYCRSCQELLSCHSCKRVISATAESLSCNYCSSKRSIPSSCPNCKKGDLVALGEGVDKFHNYLRPELGDQSMQVIAGRANSYNYDCLITIATEKILSFPQASFDSVIIASADRLLSGSRLDDRHHLLSIINELIYSAGDVLVQTYLPEDSLWSALNPENIKSFFSEELKERKKFLLPPYSKSLTLLGETTSLDTLSRQAEEIEKAALDISSRVESFSEPLGQTAPKKVAWQIQLVVPNDIYDRFLVRFQGSLAPNWSVIG